MSTSTSSTLFTGRVAPKPMPASGIADQDRIKIARLTDCLGNTFDVVTDADGHGARGQIPAIFACDEITNHVKQMVESATPDTPITQETIEACLTKAFQDTNEALREFVCNGSSEFFALKYSEVASVEKTPYDIRAEINVMWKALTPEEKCVYKQMNIITQDENGVPFEGHEPFSGGAVVTTVIVCTFVDGRKIVTTANVGDAEAFVYTHKEDGSIEITECTTAHDCGSRTERLRLKSFPVQCVFTTPDGGNLPIDDADGNPIDYAFAEGKDVYYKLLAYHAVCAEPESPEKKQKQDECCKLWRASNKAFKAHPMNQQYDQLVWSTRTAMQDRDFPSTYIVGDARATYGHWLRLQPSRAIGDFAQQQLGIVPTPVTMTLELGLSPTQCVFVASDGVHDCFTRHELAKLVLSDKTDDELLRIFVDKSKSLFSGIQHDDISFARCAVPSAR